MSGEWIAGIGLVTLAVVAGWLLPAGVMRLLAPTLVTDAPRVRNFRGKHVVLGLGLVWLPWAVAVAAAVAVVDALGAAALEGMDAGIRWAAEASLMLDFGRNLFPAMPVALVLGAFAFGLVDDMFGGHGDKGFRGHLGALVVGRLTTGGLKLFGIGALAALAAWGAPPFSAPVLGAQLSGPSFPGDRAVVWLLMTLVIAGTANLVNLMDLRPGRALKAYVALTVPVFVAFGAAAARLLPASGVSLPFVVVSILVAIAFLLGPVLAVWRYDLSERGMLGDAGANAFGVLAGSMLASVLPLPGLAVAAVVLLALNLTSERVSFSAVIERTPWLRALDRLGRTGEGAGEDAETSG